MEPIERIRELLTKLAECSAEELAELDSLCEGLMGDLDSAEPTPDNIAIMGEVVEAAEAVAGEGARRAQEAEAAQRQAEELRARFKTVKAGPDAEGAESAEGAETPTIEGEGDAGEDEGETEGESIAASAGRPGPGSRAAMMARATGRPRTPAGETERDRIALVASGGRGAQVGEELDSEGLAKLMARTLEAMPRDAAPRGDVIIASADWTSRYPEERRLDSDAFRNGLKIHDICRTGVNLQQALTASGGICSPVNVDWSVPVFATAERPLRDALPAFQADRGGLTFVPPPDIGALVGATSVWTQATDAGAPGNGITKPVLSIQCGSPTTVYVAAVPTRVQFGNMMGRFAPEYIAANTDLSVAAASRVAELNLLALLDASSSLLNSQSLLGTSRDLLATVDQVLWYYRDLHRLPDETPITAIFPRWAKNAFRADIAREVGHDDTTTPIRAVPDEMIDGWFAARGVNVVWTLDGRAAKTTGGASYQYPAQTASLVATNNPIQPWPAKTVWNLFVEGTFQFLDSGRLDLGVVRDSTLDATNDYELFTETFEGIAFRGVEALTIVSPVVPNGGSAGTISTSGYTGA